MDNMRGPTPLSSLQSDIPAADASESPSFLETAHLAKPGTSEQCSVVACTNKGKI